MNGGRSFSFISILALSAVAGSLASCTVVSDHAPKLSFPLIVLPQKNPVELPQAEIYYKTLIINYKFHDDHQPLVTNSEQLLRRIFTDSDSFANYYYEVSYGKVAFIGNQNITGDITPLLNVSASKTTCNKSVSEAQELAEALPGIDLEDYDKLIMTMQRPRFDSNQDGVENDDDAFACGNFLGGFAQNDGKFAWVAVGESDGNHTERTASVAIHEMGHTFNLAHSSVYECIDEAGIVHPLLKSSQCTLYEYKDHNSAMGNDTVTRHFSAFEKYEVGYLEGEDVEVVTQDGIFDIYPLEFPSDGKQALVIPRNPEATLGLNDIWIENRIEFGFDQYPDGHGATSGVLIRQNIRAPSSPTLHNYGALLHANPGARRTDKSEQFQDAALQVGQSFLDPVEQILITLVSKNSIKATVQIQFLGDQNKQCDPKGLVVFQSSRNFLLESPNFPAAGSTYGNTVSGYNFNSSGCGNGIFNENLNLPPGWSSQMIGGPNRVVAPGDPFEVDVQIQTSQSAPDGNYLLGLGFSSNIPNQIENPRRWTKRIQGPEDSTLPSVQLITSLGDGQTVYVDQTFDLAAQPSDNSGNFYIVRIEIDDSSPLANRFWIGPFETTWTPRGPGSYVIHAEAEDASRNLGSSTPITVNAIHHPIRLNSPSYSAARDNTFGGTLSPWVSTPEVGGTVARIEFFLDDTYLGMDDTSSTGQNWIWSLPDGFDTRQFSNGYHNFHVRAVLQNNQTLDSLVRRINIYNP